MRCSYLLFDDCNNPTEAFTSFLRVMQIPGQDIVAIDEALQKRFFQKKPDGQPLERWELKEVQTDCPQGLILQHLSACGFIAETQPLQLVYNCAAWPGALAPRAAVRLLDLIKAWQNGVRWQQTIVLGGRRPLQPDKETVYPCCAALGIDQCEAYDKGYVRLWQSIDPQTELEMMHFLWEAVKIQTGRFYTKATFVEAPMKPPQQEGGPPQRPNTEDTIAYWLNTYHPILGKILVSSGAPYGMAQDEAFWALLGPRHFTVETFGHAAPELPIANFMREVAGCVHRIRQARLGI